MCKDRANVLKRREARAARAEPAGEPEQQMPTRILFPSIMSLDVPASLNFWQ
jgi:hypothetical protein